MESFCRKLPKIELHAHLNGSLSSSTLKKLGCIEESIDKYQTINTDLKEVFSVFKIAHEATNNMENLYEATRSVIEEFAEDNVVYLELRTTPRSEETMSLDQYIDTVIKAIQENESSKIMVKLILSLDRSKAKEEQARTLDVIIKYKNQYPNLIKGVDLSGDPAKGKFFNDLFVKARENGLRTAIHCAELKNDDEVLEILKFNPDRLGHGTFLHPNYGGSAEIWKLYLAQNIPVECCMTSNVICLSATSYDKHHVQEWIKEQLPFSIATDDKGVFKTTLSNEFQLLYDNFKCSQLKLWEICNNSIEYSFASNEEKAFLKLALDQWKTKNIKPEIK
ncbi:hypothetical protein HUJ04_005248 [Dendroctonus ponderosae]